MLKPLRKRLGIGGLTFQAFRRTFATQALEIGASVKHVQGQMRHANPEMTAGTYAQVIDESVSRIVERYDQKFCPAEAKKERVN